MANPLTLYIPIKQDPTSQAEAEEFAKKVTDSGSKDSHDYLRRIPKAELHCHLAGTLRAITVAELAARAGLPLPRPADKLYQWPDFNGFLDVLRLTAQVLRRPEDFSRDRKSTRLNSSHSGESRMPSSA